MPKVYLISGANRGIGLQMVKELLAVTDTVIFAGARDANNETLVELSKQHPGVVFPIALTSGDLESNRAAANVIEAQFGKIDLVIANAGIAHMNGKVETSTLETFEEHFKVNVLGPVALFQATAALLRNATETGKFIVISSISGSVSKTPDFKDYDTSAYGASKAAVNSVTAKIQAENPDLIAGVICPGPVITDMLVNSAKERGFDPNEFGKPVEWAVPKVLEHVHGMQREERPEGYWTLFSDSIIAW